MGICKPGSTAVNEQIEGMVPGTNKAAEINIIMASLHG